ncbi:MAG: glutamate--tRNA ligase, partial [Candidatus Eremiobacteraeota bacterium]|nr:glutamate--tRNA ligase [Candidatus Eremiobacteraeota bacterium]
MRTRVAPSPTGDPHVGTAFAALANYCFARGRDGDFILRIEDTDQARSTAESERTILEALHWLGITWSEGPDVGGPHGPYRQSERSQIYRRYADELLERGDAFRCFCTPERLAEMREEQRRAGVPPAYDGRCVALPPAEIAANVAAGIPFVVRMVVPRTGTILVHDLLRGEIAFDAASIDMQVLLKSDGLPTYHLANVVDDHLMQITHVMRGEEWLPSAPKHVLLYRYFGWTMPELCHLPLLRNPDRSKLSKRKNPTGILFYRRMGYLPEALLNFLGLLLITVGEGDEMMDLRTMSQRFDPKHLSVAGPVFDVQKLDWLNARYLRETLDVDGFMERAREWAVNRTYFREIAPLAQTRIERLSDLGPLLSFFFAGRLDVTAEQLREGKLDDDTLRKAFAFALEDFEAVARWDVENIQNVLRNIAEALE